MQTYELLYLSPLQDADAARMTLRDRVTKVIQDAGGAIVAVREIARQRLSYPIQRHQAGEYVLAEFTAPGTAPKTIEHELGLMPEILRTMVTKKLEKARVIGHELEALERTKAQEETAKETIAQRAAAAPPIAEPAVIEDLDKKLEEILGKEMV